MEAEKYALSERVHGAVLQEQEIMRFAISCNNPSALDEDVSA